MPKKTVFFIFSMARTGSGYLHQWLNNHDYIRCHGEVFNRVFKGEDKFTRWLVNKKWGYFKYKLLLNKFVASRNIKYGSSAISDYLNELIYNDKFCNAYHFMDDKTVFKKNNYFSDEKAVGFKVMSEQLSYYPYLPKILEEFGLNCIWLKRKNKLEQAISWIQLEKNGISHSEKNIEISRFTLDIHQLEKRLLFIEKQEKIQKDLIEKFPQHIEVYYEDLFSDNFSKELSVLLNCNIQETFRPALKKTGKDIRETILNFDEIKKHLEQTRFEKYFT